VSVRRARRALLIVTLTIPVLTASTAEARIRPSSASTDAATARAINVTAGDLSKSVTWIGSPNTESSSDLAAGQSLVTCIKSAGGIDSKISPDPFGAYGKAIGPITADVSSSAFSPKSSATGAPTISTETAIASSPSQATTDLTGLGTKPAFSCVRTWLGKMLASEGTVTFSTASGFAARPSHGDGNGGVHVHLVLDVKGVSQPFSIDVYFYAQGRAEVEASFFDLGASYSTTATDAVLTTVMARAKSFAG
jgi:hypothetical protein